jgi:hypothetical protein
VASAAAVKAFVFDATAKSVSLPTGSGAAREAIVRERERGCQTSVVG